MLCVFFFKQKTAYEMRISDWSSDVCSSDLLPLLLLFGLFLFFLNAMQGGGSRVMQFGKAKAKQLSKDHPKVTFDDVAGCDEAVEELHERSEEHTSELQSLMRISYAVFCLKKKKTRQGQQPNTQVYMK